MNRTVFLFISLFAAVVFFSCKKSTLLGSDVLPINDSINGIYTESLSLNTKTVREDSLSTYKLDKYVLGSMQDNIFGKSTAGIFAQFKPSTFNVTFKDCTIDSVVLCLVYNGSYGDVTTELSPINVYKLTGTMSADSVYFSKRNFAYDAVSVGQKPKFIPDLIDSTDEFGSKAVMVRIPLNNQLGQDFLNADSANFATLAAFQSFFKGLYLSPDESNPGRGLVYLNLGDANTRLTIYYHTISATEQQHFNFLIREGCAHSNYFKHDYTGTPVASALTSSALSDSLVFVQSMSGVKSKITIPELKSLGNILVNKAEFEITQVVDESIDNPLNTQPARMLLVAADSLGRSIYIPDVISTNFNYGGTKSTFTNWKGQTVARYTFNIADQMQSVVNKLNSGNNDYGLFLINYLSPELADRVVLGGNNRADAAQMKLKLIYTKLP